MSATLNMQDHFAVAGQPGIAWWIKGYVTEVVEVEYVDYIEEDDEHVYTYVAEEHVNHGMVVAVMVGDDREHIIDVEDLLPLAEDAYCAGCGQIGCGWHG